MKTLMMIVAMLSTALQCSSALAELRLPSIFSDGMVIQRNQPVEVWGWAEPGSRVHVLMATVGAERTDSYDSRCRADASGRWSTRVVEGAGIDRTDVEWKLMVTEFPGDAPSVEVGIKSTNSDVTVEEPEGKATDLDQVTITDVLVGEVWLCGGQSNMEWPIEQSDDGGMSRQEMANPHIRLINAPRRASARPQEDVVASWEPCTEDTVGNWTAVGYFFAERLNRELGVPIGLISSNWGGTRIEPWIEREDLAAHPTFANRARSLQREIEEWEAQDDGRIKELRDQADEALARDQRRYWRHINDEDHGYQAGWMKPEVDDSDWKLMDLPGEWEREEESLRDFDGTIWFRRTVQIPKDWSGEDDVILELGGVDDSDQTYFNGSLIGTSTDWVGRIRRYEIPAELMKAGPVVIAVCALDPHGAGGMIGPGIALKRDDGDRIDLRGPWKWRVGLATNRTVNSGIRPPVNPGEQPTAYGSLNDGMINPFVPYQIRGAIWYQGESNAGEPEAYRALLPLMIESWREDFGDEMAFGIVQLAAFKKTSDDPDQGGWAHLRDAQRHAFATVPNTGLVVTTDVGDAADIHPRDKKTVGDRMAGWALHDVYDVDEAVPSGPIARNAIRSDHTVLVNFEHCRGGLTTTKGRREAGGFALAGPDGRFFWATATLTGKKQVRVESNDVPDPRIVSYGWQDNPARADLMNASGLPACPFKLEVQATGEH